MMREESAYQQSRYLDMSNLGHFGMSKSMTHER